MTTGYANPYVVADAEPSVRAQFIRQTYFHLGGAIAAFIAIESILLQLPGIDSMVMKMTGGMGWLLVLGAFMAVSFIANKWAMSDSSKTMQYMGLGLLATTPAAGGNNLEKHKSWGPIASPLSALKALH